MATATAPSGVVLEVTARAADSPSQERLGRIAGMLRDAEMAAHPSAHRRGPLRRRFAKH
ncbi:hypothetical protein [Blastococcus sp. PRF04-17]|uniref:hypothetical protein n=1 Tax=Blastococcus sp. PRF04-17 TaxID=2933797 RepID=UPI001FF66FEB|nr:hypothetical protein [Blastococcus sp. PRF04-17]UOY00592.1 hypothetical protein MVA48_16550 [Blastococcus sp. PRF04-17]